MIKWKLALLLMLFSSVSFALPFSITPKGSLPTSVPRGRTVSATYIVKNNTQLQRYNNYVKYLPPHVSIANGGCGRTFNLAATGQAGDSCELNLTVSGPVNANDPNPHDHLFVCLQGGVSCAGPSIKNALNVTVSLPKSTVAVGYYNDITSNQVPVTYSSSNYGVTWFLSILPSIPSGGTYNTLNGVSCGGETGLQCTTVGYYSDSLGNTFALTYASTDGGITWSAPVVPSSPSSFDNELFSVACGGTRDLQCAAVGEYNDNNSFVNFPLAYTSSDGGQNWTLVFPPTSSISNARSQLYGVACDTATGLKCTAVGYYHTTGKGANDVPLAYTSINGGVSWTPSILQPTPPLSNTDSYLLGVACDGATGMQCVAVGYYLDTGISFSLTYSSVNGGLTWSAPVFPVPQSMNIAVSHNQLFGVACDGITGLQCTTVGAYLDANSGRDVPLSYWSADAGASWTVSTVLPPPQVSANNYLNDVTCDSTGLQCTAVGYYRYSSPSNSNSFGLSYSSNDGGKTWTVSALLPSTPSGGSQLVLNAVS